MINVLRMQSAFQLQNHNEVILGGEKRRGLQLVNWDGKEGDPGEFPLGVCNEAIFFCQNKITLV